MPTVQDNSFWRFQTIFWVIAGTALFISGTTQTEYIIALVRNVYLTLFGFVSGFFLAQVLEQLRPRSIKSQLSVVIIASLILSYAAILIINPITYTMKGLAIEELPLTHWFGGGLNYALVLAIWCVLYLFKIELAGNRGETTKGLDTLAVEKGKVTKTLPIQEIFYLKAAGDYVEIHTAEDDYLRRGTMASFAKAFNESGYDFLRIHRSTLVNMAHVAGFEASSKGSFDLVLDDETRLKSGRSFQNDVKARFQDQV